MIDWHTHILPEMDDGSKTQEMSCQMIEELCSQGVEEVFATPHFYPENGETPSDFVKRRQVSCGKLVSNPFYSHIHLGAEVSICAEIAGIDGLALLKLGKTPYILLEPPYEDWQEWVYQTIFAVEARHKLKPVIAHVDRYFDIVRDKKKIWRLAELGYTIQINTSVFRKSRFHPVYKLIKEYDRIILGTDTHNMTSRPPRIEEKILRKKIGATKWHEMNNYSKDLFGGVNG